MAKSGHGILLDWNEAFRAGPEIVGGKGWNLGRLDRYGFPVPAGRVLIAAAYEEFIEHNRLRPSLMEASRAVTLENCGGLDSEARLAALRKGIEQGGFPAKLLSALGTGLEEASFSDVPLAVRSSATGEDSAKASFAGIHDSFLNVTGIENVLDAIKGCYASLWTPRAVAYRRKMGISDLDVAPAVVIMAMAEAKAAGVAFSCDPSSGREDRIVISANLGLGESVVTGAIEPDEYVMELRVRSSWPVLVEKRVGKKERMSVTAPGGGTALTESPGNSDRPALEERDIVRLSLLVFRIYEALGEGERHQDVEWVFDGEQFQIVQARPVTAIPRYTLPELRDQPDIWSNGNFRDAIPSVLSPLYARMAGLSINAILREPQSTAGYDFPPGLMLVRRFQGRLYQNLTLLQWSWYDGFGVLPWQVNEGCGGHQPEIAVPDTRPFRGMKGVRRIWRNLKLLRAMGRAKKGAATWFREIEATAASLLPKDARAMSTGEILAAFETVGAFGEDFGKPYMLLGSSGVMPRMQIISILEKHFPGRGVSLANAILAGGGSITSAEHGYRLVTLAEIARNDPAARTFLTAESFQPLSWKSALPDSSPFKTAFREFLREFGHRGVYELEIMNPRWREDPGYPLQVVRDTIDTADSGEIRARQGRLAEKAWEEINRKVPRLRRLFLKRFVREALRGAELREMSKSVVVKVSEPMRLLFLEIGRRLAEQGILADGNDVFFCRYAELFAVLEGEWNGRGLSFLVAERKVQHLEWERLSPPDLVIDDAPQYAAACADCAGGVLSGVGVAAGSAAGPAGIVRHPGEGGKLGHGNVLVAPSTDPGWTPLFLRASGIVMETGGYISHGAIVAREYGIPAVVNIPGVLQVLRDGQQIVVDGDAGKVFLQ